MPSTTPRDGRLRTPSCLSAPAKHGSAACHHGERAGTHRGSVNDAAMMGWGENRSRDRSPLGALRDRVLDLSDRDRPPVK